MADNELGGLALIAANYGAYDQDLSEDENGTQPNEEVSILIIVHLFILQLLIWIVIYFSEWK